MGTLLFPLVVEYTILNPLNQYHPIFKVNTTYINFSQHLSTLANLIVARVLLWVFVTVIRSKKSQANHVPSA